jgi:hypothetical protein
MDCDPIAAKRRVRAPRAVIGDSLLVGMPKSEKLRAKTLKTEDSE